MAHNVSAAEALALARRLLGEEQYEPAVELYDEVLEKYPKLVLGSLNDKANYWSHKEFLKCSIAFQIDAQKESAGDGFYVNFGNYCFLDTPSPDILVTAAAVRAADRHKRRCGSVGRLGKGILSSFTTHRYATALLYFAHTVSSDIFDFCVVARNYPVQRLADFGCGVGLQAMTVSKLLPGVQSVHMFEVQDYMLEPACEGFKANGLGNYHMNRALDGPIDGFYSFRACGYVFSVDAYLDQIRAARTPNSWAMMDVGERFDAAYQKSQLRTIFMDSTVLYPFGSGEDRFDRMLFDHPL